MVGSMASELPAELLERIFSVGWPHWESGEPLLTGKQRVRCQLVCKAWRHALDVRRWPLWRLTIQSGVHIELAPGAPPAAQWLRRVRPGVRCLEIQLGFEQEDEFMEPDRESPLRFDSPEAQAAHRALLALRPRSALERLTLSAPFPVLERFVQDLGCFTGLRQLYLRALELFETDDLGDAFEVLDKAAVLRPSMLRQLPPQLEHLSASNFNAVRFEPAAGTSVAAGGVEPFSLPPGLTRMRVHNANAVVLNMPLPGLAELSLQWCSRIRLTGEGLHLPQLTSLEISAPPGLPRAREVLLRCSAMPALARLSTHTSRVGASDSFSALQRLTRLEFAFADGQLEGQAAQGLAAAGATQLTQLECNSVAFLSHLPAWPHLQGLLLAEVRPTTITAEHVALLAAAPSLRRLTLKCKPYYALRPTQQAEDDRMQELQQALPRCVVEDRGLVWQTCQGLMLRCHLVCKAWRHALDAQRWPLRQLELSATNPADVPQAAPWVQSLRPGVQRLVIELGGDDGEQPLESWAAEEAVPAAAAVHGALLALQPRSALHSLTLRAPFSALERMVADLGSFTGLKRLHLGACYVDEWLEDPWDAHAQLNVALLRQLPPQLESLTAHKFHTVRLEHAAAGEAGVAAGGAAGAAAVELAAAPGGAAWAAAGGEAAAGSGQAPPHLLPCLTRLAFYDINVAMFNMPLPRLAELDFNLGQSVSMAGEQLRLPQLTQLDILTVFNGVPLRCAVMPDLAQLNLELQTISVALGAEAAQMAADARLAHLTHLTSSSIACLAHLPAWPQLRELVLTKVSPASLNTKHVALLAAAPGLRRLTFGKWDAAAKKRAATARLKELRRTLPQCSLRCQLVCKSWRHALSARRWPLGQLALYADPPTWDPPAAAIWMQRAQPGVQRLRIELSGDELYAEEGSLDVYNPTVQAVLSALLALQPSVLEELTLWAPCPVLELFITAALGRFAGLKQLRLDVELVRTVTVDVEGYAEEYVDYADDSYFMEVAGEVASWHRDNRAVLRTPLLKFLPPQLECLTLSNFAAECNNLACLQHLPAWPALQDLQLTGVRPTSIQAQQLALLAAAPSLRRLAFKDYFSWCAQTDEAERSWAEELRQLRCQLVCKAWRHALDARRWPLWQLQLAAVGGTEDALPAPPPALWVQHAQPGVQHLTIKLGGTAGFLEEGKQPLTPDIPAVQAVQAALLALQPPSALRSLALSAPFRVLERFLPDLGRFTSLQRLELRAEMTVDDDEEEGEVLGWNLEAVLCPPHLRHLPPQLESLTLSNFYAVGLEEGSDAAPPAAAAAAAADNDGAWASIPVFAAAAGEAGPAQLPPGLTQLTISHARAVLLDMPLPSLAEIDVQQCSIAVLAGERLQLPQLTRLVLHQAWDGASVSCDAMPALARLACSCTLQTIDSFTQLRQLTSLDLRIGNPELAGALVASVASSLRSLTATVPLRNEPFAQEAARVLAAAGASQLTRLEFNSAACLAHLPAWPHLQELLLGVCTQPASKQSSRRCLPPQPACAAWGSTTTSLAQ
ncbi:toll-like receptor 3 [Chlorella sorokiniana]|uniref:Toll-like receptor 3 n=1 Tax=Chlorella sorokiniana TaxID=3076 RepID=A0A2P6TGG2_CHLSO|nr:toll-like receptor 3 [Chlorella sorokiniana]|eukprot:PRW33212.1 toll-like receptor 3 [Chlorella sorokiniana]